MREIFPADADIKTYADFEPEGAVENPGYYVHVVKKPK